MSIKKPNTPKPLLTFYREKIYPLDKFYQNDKDWDVFNDICYRAYTIISQHDAEVITQHAKIAREYLFSTDMLSKTNQKDFIEKIPDAEIRGISNMSLSYQIKHGHDFFESESFNVKEWDLLFALIALYEIDTCMLLQKSIDSGSITYPNYNKREIFQAYANPALEAVLNAESAISQSDEIEQKVKETTSEKARNAAFKRHEKYQGFYNEFIRYYYDGDFKSKSKAADQFLESKDKQDIPLAPTNAKRSILDALRKHEKGLKALK